MLNYLNIHYGVSFGFVFSILFFQPAGEGAAVDIRLFHLSGISSVSFILMLAYLFLDWAVAVRHHQKYDSVIDWKILVPYCMSIWILGSICVSSLGEHTFTLPLIYLYTLTVSFYQGVVAWTLAGKQIFGSGYRYSRLVQLGVALTSVSAICVLVICAYWILSDRFLGRQYYSDEVIVALLALWLVSSKLIRLMLLNPTKVDEDSAAYA